MPTELFAVISTVLLLSACENDKIPEELPVVKDNVSFALDIQPILSAQCARCHNPADVAPDLRKGFAYESLLEDGKGVIPGNAEESELTEMLEWAKTSDNPMPPTTPLSPLNIALIKKWIDEGAQDN
ncbi:MAG: hypothetical protein JSU09_04145 [Bacteroidetes bacterium]|nr:hypothetical protein [Bacteroidota bacterium]